MKSEGMLVVKIMQIDRQQSRMAMVFSVRCDLFVSRVFLAGAL